MQKLFQCTILCYFNRHYTQKWSWFWEVLANGEIQNNFKISYSVRSITILLTALDSVCNTVAGFNQMPLDQDCPTQVYLLLGSPELSIDLSTSFQWLNWPMLMYISFIDTGHVTVKFSSRFYFLSFETYCSFTCVL